MSYILEALKKAQAERQLGSAPTLHAQPVHPAGAGGGAHRRPWPIAPGVLVLGAMTLLAAGAALFMWPQRSPVVSPVVAPAAPPVAAPSAPAVMLPAAPLPAAPTVASARAAAGPTAANAPAVTRAPAVRAAAPTPVAVVALPTPASVAAPAMTAQPPTPVRALPTPTVGAAPAPAAEEDVPAARDLPEAIRRELPQVVFGGYIYSPNRADRLLLVDKVLRHEGEEVAPGLMLEALRPKSAVLNYRGYRYRLPY